MKSEVCAKKNEPNQEKGGKHTRPKKWSGARRTCWNNDHGPVRNRNFKKDTLKKYCLGTISKRFLLEALNMFDSANLNLISDVDHDK